MNPWKGSCFCLIPKNIVHVPIWKGNSVLSIKGHHEHQETNFLYFFIFILRGGGLRAEVTYGRAFSCTSLKNSQMKGADRFIMNTYTCKRRLLKLLNLPTKRERLQPHCSYSVQEKLHFGYLIVCSCMFSNQLDGLRRHSKEKSSNVEIFCLFHCASMSLCRDESERTNDQN